MGSEANYSADSLNTEHAVRAEQIRLLYHQGVPIQVLGIVTAIIAAVMFRQVADPLLLSLWLAGQIVVTALRLLLNYRFTQVAQSNLELEWWGWFYIIGTLVSGFMWGCLALFYEPSWPVSHQVVLFAIYTGIIAGAFNTNSSVRWAFPAFFLPPVLLLMYVMLTNMERFGELAMLFIIYLTLMSVSSRRYHQRLTESLEIRHRNAELAHALEESNRRLMQLSEVDELTNLYNRRSMERFIKEEWERHKRNGRPLSLLYIDIDYFKQYNDTYGHHEGDQVLIRVGNILQHYARRTSDMAARFGGEEFAIILPETDNESAVALAEKVRTSVQALKITHEGSEAAKMVTASIGVATRVPDESADLSALKIEADKALYAAKSQGRNCVVNSAG